VDLKSKKITKLDEQNVEFHHEKTKFQNLKVLLTFLKLHKNPSKNTKCHCCRLSRSSVEVTEKVTNILTLHHCQM